MYIIDKIKPGVTILFFLISLGILTSLPTQAFAVDPGGIICAPTDSKVAESGTADVYLCVNNIYRFSIVIGSIMAVMFIVIAGYLYMFSGGSDANVSTAKSLISSSLLGVAILLGGLLILKQINPEILKLKSISPTRIDGQSWILPVLGGNGGGSGSGGGNSGSSGGSPKPVTGGSCDAKESGGCTRAVISACPGMAAQMENALRICNKESAGGQVGIPSSVDLCDEQTTGQRIAWSWGLWQINIFNSAGLFPECNGVFTEKTNPPSGAYRPCHFGSGGRAAYDRCVNALKDPTRNTRQACVLFNQKQGSGIRGWGPWTNSANKCGVPLR